MKNLTSRGFTIVELIIVVTVIAILASITIVSYNGAQGRARDADRYSDVKAIVEGLTLYRSQNATYPSTITMGVSNYLPSGCSLPQGYSYSVATDSSWLQALESGQYIDKAPISPVNNCTHYYSYSHSLSATQYGCTYGTGFYILQVQGTDGTTTPSQALTTAPTGCTSWPSSLISNSTSWILIGFDDGVTH